MTFKRTRKSHLKMKRNLRECYQMFTMPYTRANAKGWNFRFPFSQRRNSFLLPSFEVVFGIIEFHFSRASIFTEQSDVDICISTGSSDVTSVGRYRVFVLCSCKMNVWLFNLFFIYLFIYNYLFMTSKSIFI